MITPHLSGRVLAIHGTHGLTPVQSVVRSVPPTALRLAGAAYVGMVAHEMSKKRGTTKNARLAMTIAAAGIASYAPILASVAALLLYKKR